MDRLVLPIYWSPHGHCNKYTMPVELHVMNGSMRCSLDVLIETKDSVFLCLLLFNAQICHLRHRWYPERFWKKRYFFGRWIHNIRGNPITKRRDPPKHYLWICRYKCLNDPIIPQQVPMLAKNVLNEIMLCGKGCDERYSWSLFIPPRIITKQGGSIYF